MRLTIGVATRGRPKLLRWTVEETMKNIRADTRVVVLADEDDVVTSDVCLPAGVTVHVAEREDSVGAKWNRLMEVAPADIYMPMCDYRPQITPGFDEKIIEALEIFPDGIGVAYQHLANLSFPSNQAVTHKMAELMGGIYVTCFPYWFTDHWLDDVCKMTGRYVFSDGDTVVGKRENGTQDFREPYLWASLYDALQDEREAMAQKILDATVEPYWRKQQLKATWPLIHERSRMINNMVRQMKGNAPWDERYKRIRASGIEKLQSIYQSLERKAA